MNSAEGKGFAYEAALAVRKFAYETLGWNTVVSTIEKNNARSIALAVRLGAKFDYVFSHSRFGDMDVYRHLPPSEVAQ